MLMWQSMEENLGLQGGNRVMNEKFKNIYDDLYKSAGDDLSTELSKVQQELSEIFDGAGSEEAEKLQEENRELPEKPGPQTDMDKPAQDTKETAAQEAAAQAEPEPDKEQTEEPAEEPTEE